METTTKLDLFKNELSLISTDSVRSLVSLALSRTDEKFFTAPASSTGKYHPAYALGEGGLMRHTKAAVKFAHTLLGLKHNKLSTLEYDYVIAALILHDTCKSGVKWEDKYTKHEHPILVRQLLENESLSESSKEAWNTICDLIASHMGQWSSNSHSNYILPTPKTRLQELVHECDYLASRNFIHLTVFDSDVKDTPAPTTWRDKEPTDNQLTTIHKWLYEAQSIIGEEERDEISGKLENHTLNRGEASDIICRLKTAVEGEVTTAQLESLKSCLLDSKLRSKLNNADIKTAEWGIKNPAGLTKVKAQSILSKVFGA